jgi:hypothetical protein
LSSQGNYDQIISYVPGSPEECVIGGIDQYHWNKAATTGGSWGGWNQISLWSAFPSSPSYIHADNHEMKFNSTGQYWYGNDGGVGSTFGSPAGFDSEINNIISMSRDDVTLVNICITLFKRRE